MIVTITFPADPELPEATHDRAMAIVGGVHAGDDAEAGLAAMQPLRELGTLAVRHVRPDAVRGRADRLRRALPAPARCARTGSPSTWTSSPTTLIDLIAAKAQERPAPLTLVNTFQMGGAIADVDPEATAFAERTSPYMISIDGMWPDPAADERRSAGSGRPWTRCSRFGTGGVYLNFTGLPTRRRPRAWTAPSAATSAGWRR